MDRSLAATRSAAQASIVAGKVAVDGQVITKSGTLVTDAQHLAIHGSALAYVSRGGIKLAAALDRWQLELSGRICLDIGTSTGGFADCMLQRGASLVFGVENGHGQLAARLQNEDRLQLLERTNARYLTREMLPAGISFFTVDVSFISATLVLPAVISAAFSAASRGSVDLIREAVILVKPQFEAGREAVGRHGLVRGSADHERSIERVRECVISRGARSAAWMESPIAGGDGNREFLLYARFGAA